MRTRTLSSTDSWNFASHDHAAAELLDQLLRLLILPLPLSLVLLLTAILLLRSNILLLLGSRVSLLAPAILLLLLRIPLPHRRHVRCWAARQVDVHSSLIRLRGILQSLLLTYLFHLRLDLLNVPWTVVALTHDDVQVCLAGRLRISYAFFEDVFGFLGELPVQVDRVGGDTAFGVVLAENEFGGLLVVAGHGGAVGFAFFGELVGSGAVPAIVGLFRLGKTIGLVEGLRLGCCQISAQAAKGDSLRTLAKDDDRLPASCRARSRRRSYSCSASCD